MAYTQLLSNSSESLLLWQLCDHRDNRCLQSAQLSGKRGETNRRRSSDLHTAQEARVGDDI